MKIAFIAGLSVLALVAVVAVILTIMQARPIRVDIAGGGPCPGGVGDCRWLAVKEVSPTHTPAPGAPTPTIPAYTAPVFAAADFAKGNATGLGANNVVLPVCADPTGLAYYAYAHPQSQGNLSRFVIGGIDQSSALAPPSTPPYVELDKIRQILVVTINPWDCSYAGGQIVEVSP